MKILLSYKFADEDIDELQEFIDNIKDSLHGSGHELITTFYDKDMFDKNSSTNRQIMDKALKYLRKSDAHLIIIRSPEKSEGMLIEVGYSYAIRKKMILAIKKGLKTRWVSELVNEIIEFDTLEDLYNKLRSIR